MYWIVMDEMTSDCIYFHLMLFRNIWKLVFLNMNNKTTNPQHKKSRKKIVFKKYLFTRLSIYRHIYTTYTTLQTFWPWPTKIRHQVSHTHGVTKEQKKANYCLCFLKDILWSVFFHVGVQNDTFFIFASSSLYSSFTELYNNAS